MKVLSRGSHPSWEYQKAVVLTDDGFLVTHCTENWNTIIQTIKLWHEALPKILDEVAV